MTGDSKPFVEGFAAFPFDKQSRTLPMFTPVFDNGYCPYIKDTTDWHQWWKGYRTAATEDETEFLNTDYLALEEML